MADLRDARIKTLTRSTSQAPELNMQGSSTAGDVAAGLGFVLDVYQQGQQKEELNELKMQAAVQEKEEMAGVNAALNVISLQGQGVGTLKLRDAIAKGRQGLSSSGLAAYYKELDKVGIKSEARRLQDEEEIIAKQKFDTENEIAKQRRDAVQKGREITLAWENNLIANGFNAEFISKAASEGFTDDELIQIGVLWTQSKEIATREAALKEEERKKYKFDEEVAQKEKRQEINTKWNDFSYKVGADLAMASRIFHNETTPEGKIEAGKILLYKIDQADQDFQKWKNDVLREGDGKFSAEDLSELERQHQTNMNYYRATYDRQDVGSVFSERQKLTEAAIANNLFEPIRKGETAEEHSRRVGAGLALTQGLPLTSGQESIIRDEMFESGKSIAESVNKLANLKDGVFRVDTPINYISESNASPEVKAEVFVDTVGAIGNPFNTSAFLNPTKFKELIDAANTAVSELGLAKVDRMIEDSGFNKEEFFQLGRTYIGTTLAKGLELGNIPIKDMKVVVQDGSLKVQGDLKNVWNAGLSSPMMNMSPSTSNISTEQYRKAKLNIEKKLNSVVNTWEALGMNREDAIKQVTFELYNSLPNLKPKDESEQ